ncbi:target of EGR1 protein 1 [Mixophyes fleayi]|uniref:target of EGR1 protein 1 n=1 Tax=Mixophyes fleayi TaxID=3061075 RepID=UPI003F4E0E75
MSCLKVPVIDVHNDNFGNIWPSMLLAMKTSTFIAVDTELSGLGSRKSLLNQCVEERYKAICHAARTRSILSLGIACFKELPEKGENVYLSQIYNLTLLCMEDYTIEPQSVKFLVQHGFDFNKQYSLGIPYYKGNDKGDERHLQSVRTLFLELLLARKPLILHNGLIDLAFLYQCFYAHLPDKMVNFIADLSEMFPAGIYDTKYASEFETRFTASYLEYAYKKCKRDNCRLLDVSGKHLAIEFTDYPASMSVYVDYRLCSLSDPETPVSDSAPPHICQRFSAYGWCPNGVNCTNSHNIDLIITEDEKGAEDKRRKRRKRKKGASQQGTEINVEVNGEPLSKQANISGAELGEMTGGTPQGDATLPPETESSELTHPAGEAVQTEPSVQDFPTNKDSTATSNIPAAGNISRSAEGGTHRAGFDAFMTGYIMGYVWMLKKGTSSDSSTSHCLPDCHNKVYLSGKNVPLQIVKSIFSKSTRAHLQKMKLISGDDS